MSEPNSAAQLMRLVNGYQLSMAIHVAATLRLADHLENGSLACDTLAAKSETHPDALYRLLRMLAAAGVFREESDKRFSLTPMGECLKTDSLTPVAPWALQIGRPNYWQAWGDLLHSIRTGESAFAHVHGLEPWDYRAQHSQEGKVFDAAMGSLTRQVIKPILAAYDFGAFHSLVDVGGGRGAILAAMLAAYPHMQGILLDRPSVVAEAAQTFRDAGVAGRCTLQPGDFFASVPKGADAYFLKSILHDWSDTDSLRILKSCRAAIPDNGKLLIVEYAIEEPNDGLIGKMIDVNMLAIQQGRVRRIEEFSDLLAASGFRLNVLKRTASSLSIIEALPA